MNETKPTGKIRGTQYPRSKSNHRNIRHDSRSPDSQITIIDKVDKQQQPNQRRCRTETLQLINKTKRKGKRRKRRERKEEKHTRERENYREFHHGSAPTEASSASRWPFSEPERLLFTPPTSQHYNRCSCRRNPNRTSDFKIKNTIEKIEKENQKGKELVVKKKEFQICKDDKKSLDWCDSRRENRCLLTDCFSKPRLMFIFSHIFFMIKLFN